MDCKLDRATWQTSVCINKARANLSLKNLSLISRIDLATAKNAGLAPAPAFINSQGVNS
jgi:hypothetical protein